MEDVVPIQLLLLVILAWVPLDPTVSNWFIKFAILLTTFSFISIQLHCRRDLLVFEFIQHPVDFFHVLGCKLD